MKFFTKSHIAGLVLCLGLGIHAQGTIQWTVTFDTSPYIEPSSSIGVKYYWEQGMEFRPITPDGAFSRTGAEHPLYVYPRNGSPFLSAYLGDSLSVKEANNRRFGIVSVDIAEWSTWYATPKAVQFIGYWLNGTAVTITFTTDGIIDGAGPINDFQTFYFDWRFRDIVLLEVPGHGFHLDNMRFSNVVPEPGFRAIGMAAAAAWLLRFRKLK